MHLARLPGERAEEAVQGVAAAQLRPYLFDLGHRPRLPAALTWISKAGLAAARAPSTV
jgi:hypothetical protein